MSADPTPLRPAQTYDPITVCGTGQKDRPFDVPIQRIEGPHREHLTEGELPGPSDWPPNVIDFETHPLAWTAFIAPCPEHGRECGPYCEVLWSTAPADEQPTEPMIRRAASIPTLRPRRTVGEVQS